jgi:hypothetical protein
MKDDDAESGSTVGYQRPPKEHQFKKGRSGNPRGRPRKVAAPQQNSSRVLEDLVLGEAYRPVTIREGDQVIELPMIQAVVRSLGVAAIKGNRQAQISIANMVNAIEARHELNRLELYKVVVEGQQRLREEFERCDREGRPRREIYPHPDDIIVSPWSSDVCFVGPMDKREKQEWDEQQELKRDALARIDALRGSLNRNPRKRKSIEAQMAAWERLCLRIDALYPSEEIRRSPGYVADYYLKRAGLM